MLEDWTTPEYWAVLGTPGETRRFKVRVRGPLPGRPAETSEFVMVVKRAAATSSGERAYQFWPVVSGRPVTPASTAMSVPPIWVEPVPLSNGQGLRLGSAIRSCSSVDLAGLAACIQSPRGAENARTSRSAQGHSHGWRGHQPRRIGREDAVSHQPATGCS